MATGLVRDNATQLAGYQATLGELITETSTPGSTAGMAPRPADAPLPGNAQAFGALMVIWEAVPRLEAAIRLAIAGHPGRRRGGSPANFLEALQSIVALSGGLDEDGEAAAARILERLVRPGPPHPRHRRGAAVAARAAASLPVLRVLLPAGAGRRAGPAGPRGVLRPPGVRGAVPGGVAAAARSRIRHGRRMTADGWTVTEASAQFSQTGLPFAERNLRAIIRNLPGFRRIGERRPLSDDGSDRGGRGEAVYDIADSSSCTVSSRAGDGSRHQETADVIRAGRQRVR